jgi:ribonucleoside-diphosphate reductase alpha chain
MIEVNPIFEAAARSGGFLSEGLMDQVATEGTLANVRNVPESVKQVFVCAHDVAPVWHMRMQAAFQRHCDASISKTINFPESATVEDVEAIYRMAYELRCKGVTVYRNGCRKNQPMALKDSDKVHAAGDKAGRDARTGMALEPAVLPELMSGIRVRQLTPFGNMHINITVDPKTEREMEVFAQLGKGGDLANSDLEAICRMVSLWLRAGGNLEQVVRQLHSIGSSLQVHTKEGKIMSLGDGLARALQKYMRAKADFGLRSLLIGESSPEKKSETAVHKPNGNGNGLRNGNKTPSNVGGGAGATGELRPSPVRVTGRDTQWQEREFKVVCPDCRSPLRFGEGCVTCESCGFSEC